ncbi:DciA family protein [Luteitalea sp.]|uniref:DciA family protein n=1 Tax=Luteitalea sp. TaxID=2004800 RepID=UPI0037C7186B
MFSSKELAPGTVMKLIAEQPHSWGKVEASWHLAVGGGMARLCSPVRESDGVIYVRAQDARVAEQLDLHRRVIEGRLRELLGDHGRAFSVV